MKKILCVVICMLMCATVYTVAGTGTKDVSPSVIAGIQNYMPNRDPWDLLLNKNIGVGGSTGAVGNAGAEFDGTNLYSTRWASTLIHRYDKTGALLEEFSIAGVSGLRDLAYDGTQYMYGGAAAGTIWKMDFTTKTLVATITGSFQSRAIAYDTDLDILYVSNWGDPVWKVNPTTGAILGQFNLVTTLSTYGLAYDPNPDGNPMLWVFDQTTGATATIYQWDLTAGAFTGVTHNVGLDVGSGVGIAGGFWASPDFAEGLFCLGGCVQDSTAPGTTDYLFAYEVYTTGPPNFPPSIPSAPAGPSSGNIGTSYSFTASTTDPESDQISYMFDWGDGNNSGWLGPYASGATATGSHTWGALGAYNIKVKAKDIKDHETDWSSAHIFTIVDSALLKIDWIKGGLFKVSASVHNIGGVAATNVAWTITFTGGAFIGKETTGTIASLAPGAAEIIKSKFILGFGATVVKVTATIPDSTATMEKPGQILLFLIKI